MIFNLVNRISYKEIQIGSTRIAYNISNTQDGIYIQITKSTFNHNMFIHKNYCFLKCTKEKLHLKLKKVL